MHLTWAQWPITVIINAFILLSHDKSNPDEHSNSLSLLSSLGQGV